MPRQLLFCTFLNIIRYTGAWYGLPLHHSVYFNSDFGVCVCHFVSPYGYKHAEPVIQIERSFTSIACRRFTIHNRTFKTFECVCVFAGEFQSNVEMIYPSTRSSSNRISHFELATFPLHPPHQPYKIGGNITHTHRIVQELK